MAPPFSKFLAALLLVRANLLQHYCTDNDIGLRIALIFPSMSLLTQRRTLRNYKSFVLRRWLSASCLDLLTSIRASCT